MRPGPDGLHTLCRPCFHLYAVNHTLAIFLWPSMQVSVLYFPGSVRITRYRLRARSPGKEDNERFLNPVILDIESDTLDTQDHSAAQPAEIGGHGSSLTSIPQTHETPDQSEAQGGTTSTPVKVVSEWNAPPIDGRSQNKNGIACDPQGKTQGSKDSRQDPERAVGLSEDKMPSPVVTTDSAQGACHDTPDAEPGNSSSGEPATSSAPWNGSFGSPKAVMKLSGQTVSRGTNAYGSQGFPQWPMPSFDRRGRPEASVSEAQPMVMFCSVKATLVTQAGPGAVHRFTMPVDASFESFERTVSGLFRLDMPFTVWYRDEDGDEVNVVSSNELAEMFVIAERETIWPVRLTVSVGQQE